MFGTFAFAEVPFAVQDISATPPPIIISSVGGSVSKRKQKKYNVYEIFGKLYRLTEKEYELYLAQRKAFEKKYIKEYKAKTETTNIDEIFNVPEFEIKEISIPLFDRVTIEQLYVQELNDILELLRQRELKLKKIKEEDEMILELLLSMDF